MKKPVFDAQAAIGFVTSQTSHIEREVNRTVYPAIRYPFLIPVDTSAHPFAKTVTYFSSDQHGKAEWINGNAGDIPLAGTSLTKHEKPIAMAGIGYGFGYEEINQAQMAGHNLQAEDALAARQIYEEHVDGVALFGDAEKNFEGLINHTDVTATGVTTGDWDTATTAQILADVNEALNAIGTGTKNSAMADTLLMSHEKFNFLASTQLNGTTMTLLEFIRKNNAYTAETGQALTIRSVRGLETAGVGTTSRMVAYRRNPQVLKLHIPMPHRFLPVFQETALYFVVPGVFRLGGLDIRRPAEVRYFDGI